MSSLISQSSVNDEILVTAEQNDELQKRTQRIKEIIANSSSTLYHVDDLVMIDAIQRLGLQYYFENEIGRVLRRRYESYDFEEGLRDCHDTALCFRLFRQHGYNVSSECFEKFKDKDGNFKQQELAKDIKGLMSLYEAYHMHVQGDDILDDVGRFSEHQLRKIKNNETSSSKGSIIENTLMNPFHKTLPRFMAFEFLENFENSMESLHNLSSEEKNWIKEMRYMATIDINMAKINHKREITQVSKWLERLRLEEELKFARNKPTKWHMGSLACLPNPDMGAQRIDLTKAISFIYIIDDIFDVNGTLDELILFTEVVSTWEYDSTRGMPKYMRVCIKAFYEHIDEISYKTFEIHGWSPKEFLQQKWKDLFDAFLTEAKWFASRHTPSTDEYLKNGIISCGVDVVCAYLSLLLGERGSNSEGNGHLNNSMEIVRSVATIFRLWDDLGSAKDENQDGHDGSYITCYMNEHKGSSVESVREHVHEMISDAWKRLNRTCQSSSTLSTCFKASVLNLARMVPVMYDYDDHHRLPSLEKYMKSLQ